MSVLDEPSAFQRREFPEVPAELCRFRTFAARGRDGADEKAVYDLLQGRLRFAPVDSFNDPFEARPYYVAAHADAAKQREAMLKYMASLPQAQGNSTSARRRWAENAISGRTMEELVDLARTSLTNPRNRSEITILCLADLAAISTPLPWSHYADSHRGVCVQFRGDLYPLKLAFPVEYNDEYPTLKIPRTEEDGLNRVWKVLLRKCSDWSYEREYRVIRNKEVPETVAGNLGVQWDGEVALASKDIVISITLGALMPTEVRDRLIVWLRENAPHVVVWQAALHTRRYEVTRSRLPI